MKKLVFFLVGVCLAAGSAILIISPTSTEACGYSMPVTLLELYKKSDAIYIGRFTGTESGELISEDERHSYTELNKYFDISYTLKGAPAKTFTQVGADYASKDQNKGYETLEKVEAASVIPDIHLEEEDEDVLKPGDVVLLFVRVGDEGERLELTDYSDGMKKLPAEDLRVYEDRIKELNVIFSDAKPDPEKITDWLVRCAEDRATRWEGAVELRLSFAALDAQNRRDAKRKAKQISGTSNDDDDDNDEDDDDDESETEDPGSTRKHYAEFLNEYHKQTLSNVLLNSEFQTVPQPTDRAVLVHGDRELISLISRWADTRLTELFMSRLRGGAYTSAENTELMESISSILNDQLLADVAEKHSDVDHQDDDDAVEESDLEDDAEESSEEDESVEAAPDTSDTVADGPDTDATEDNDNAVVDENSTDAPETCEVDKKPVITYKQFRQNLLDKFLARAEILISDPTKRVVKAE